ncbi:transaldolase family protein [Mycobacterium xenopi 4042]|uniref:Transaldolase family protein n=1 Tax=Mycobacterium xenopi 4042 TaxID=1299334 RepID=X7YR48_MYCXE|nr:transaldolase family protein [Mycobacterium xenopi 4042]
MSRDRIESGNLQELIDTKCVVGVTSNPTIFQKAIAGSDRYNEQIADLAKRGADVDSAVRTIVTDDVRPRAMCSSRNGRPLRGWTGESRSKLPRAGARHREDDRAGRHAVENRRPPKPVHQDPGH